MAEYPIEELTETECLIIAFCELTEDAKCRNLNQNEKDILNRAQMVMEQMDPSHKEELLWKYGHSK